MPKIKIGENTALPKLIIKCRIFFKLQKTEPFSRLIFSRSENVFFPILRELCFVGRNMIKAY